MTPRPRKNRHPCRAELATLRAIPQIVRHLGAYIADFESEIYDAQEVTSATLRWLERTWHFMAPIPPEERMHIFAGICYCGPLPAARWWADCAGITAEQIRRDRCEVTRSTVCPRVMYWLIARFGLTTAEDRAHQLGLVPRALSRGDVGIAEMLYRRGYPYTRIRAGVGREELDIIHAPNSRDLHADRKRRWFDTFHWYTGRTEEGFETIAYDSLFQGLLAVCKTEGLAELRWYATHFELRRVDTQIYPKTWMHDAICALCTRDDQARTLPALQWFVEYLRFGPEDLLRAFGATLKTGRAPKACGVWLLDKYWRALSPAARQETPNWTARVTQ